MEKRTSGLYLLSSCTQLAGLASGLARREPHPHNHTKTRSRKISTEISCNGNGHLPWSALVSLPHLRLRWTWHPAPNSCSNRFAFPNSLLGSHVSFQHTLYSQLFPARLLPTIFLISHSPFLSTEEPASDCCRGKGVLALGGLATASAGRACDC